MTIAGTLKHQISKNDYCLYVVEADDLIAAWVYQYREKHKRSYNFSQVPTEYRYSAPPSEKSPKMKCRVTFSSKGTQQINAPFTSVSPKSAIHCHIPPSSQKRAVDSIDKLKAVDFAKRNVAPYISPFLDSVTLGRVVKDLGITGKVVTKEIKGVQYIVFGGYAGIRSLFRGTKYSSRNAKVVQMAIGSLGIKNMAVNGARITIFLTVGLTIVQCILEDDATMITFAGRVTTDLLKTGLAAIAGGVTGLAVGACTTIAAFPIAFAIGIGLATGWTLESIDTHFGLTNKLIASLDQFVLYAAEKREQLGMELGRKFHEVEKEIIYRSYGFDVDKPFGSQNYFR